MVDENILVASQQNSAYYKITLEKLFGAIFMFLSAALYHFKSSLYLLQLFRRMMQRCFAVKLQKCFLD